MRDMSTMPKKGQLGFVDKAFMTEGEKGFRIGKVRIREERFPSIGDKFCSRCGQKGTVGLIIPEKDMPFTKDGIRPDIIINPHAIPTRMTIGQLIESLMGKACVLHGGFGNCTAYTNNGTKHESFGSVLTEYGYHSSGTQVLYNGMTGEEIKSDIYIGPIQHSPELYELSQGVSARISGRQFHAQICFKGLERPSRTHHTPKGTRTPPHPPARRRNGETQRRVKHRVQRTPRTNECSSREALCVYDRKNSSRTSHPCWSRRRRSPPRFSRHPT